ncbi:MAG: CpaE family protein [Actinomycetales bacterium]|jgi:pilus assembly protein CpaE
MAILWNNDPRAAERYSMAVGETLQPVESASLALRVLESDQSQQLVIIGPDIDIDAACTLAEITRVERPDVGVVLLRRRLDVSLLTQALRAGVREVVPSDDLTAVADACRHSRDISAKLSGGAAPHGSREGRIVTVFSAKGGVGKTTFSTNLGAHLAATGSRTLLVDLDLAFGDVAISLQLLPERTVTDLVPMSGHLDEQGLASVVTTHPASGLETVCAPAEPGDADRVQGPTIGELLRVAKRAYDFIIIDTPPAFTEHVLAAFDISDQIILLATLDIPALKNLRLTLDTLDLLGNPTESRVVVVNRSDAKAGLRPADVVTSIKQEIGVMVPSSSDVPASVNRGVAILLEEPRHPVSVALRQLVDEFIRPSNEPAPPARETRSGFRALTRGSRR